ncbi:phage tail terminator-like protein [Bradyrhizobium embrapense]|uniref:phage tail terminator-like protein n=1 Tax=Bradyrhizobium embrapense TaxID=630921 RepID=UPI00067DE96E|nr:phage tail terminator-like protein [Bradyrhizobium embrapense]
MVDQPYDEVFDAIRGYLGYVDVTNNQLVAGDWDFSVAPLVYENEGDSSPSGEIKSWVLVILNSQLYGQQSIGGGVDPGGNRWDEEGTLWFHVFTPRGIGSRDARRIAKGLANMFRGKTMLNDRLEFLDADMGAGDPGAENANYYLMSVSIEWRLTEAE